MRVYTDSRFTIPVVTTRVAAHRSTRPQPIVGNRPRYLNWRIHKSTLRSLGYPDLPKHDIFAEINATRPILPIAFDPVGDLERLLNCPKHDPLDISFAGKGLRRQWRMLHSE